jgi:hypothetical protein
VRRLLAARVAKLLGLQTFGMLLLIFRRRVVAIFAIAALQRDDFSHAPIPFPGSAESGGKTTR